MSNKLISLFVLIIAFSGIYLVYHYFFVVNVGSLKLDVGSFTGVKVELNGEFKNQYKTTCNKTCNFNNIPPINYTLSISKTGYKTQNKDIKISRGENFNQFIDLQKMIYLEQVNPDKIDKINLLKFKTATLKIDKDNFTNSGQIAIGVKDRIVYYYKFNPGFGIYSFSNGVEKNILLLGDKPIKNVFFNKNDGLILVNSMSESSVFDLDNNINYSINIKDDLIYVKKTLEEYKLLLKTADSTYIYDLKTNTGIKNSVYNDYIILGNDLVLGLINKSDNGKLSILNFKNNGQDKLILNNLSSRDRKVVFETEFDIKYIELIDNKVILTTTDSKQFEVKELSLSSGVN